MYNSIIPTCGLVLVCPLSIMRYERKWDVSVCWEELRCVCACVCVCVCVCVCKRNAQKQIVTRVKSIETSNLASQTTNVNDIEY